MKALRIILAAAIAGAPLQAFAAKNDGGQPGAFLDYAASARSLGMGHAFTAIANDPSAVYWNPSATAVNQQRSLVAQFSTLMENSSYGFVGYSQPWHESAGFGVGIVNLQSGSIPKRDGTGNKTGDYSAVSNAFFLSGAMKAGQGLSFGSTVKVVRESIDGKSGTGLGLDAASLFRMNDYFQMGLMLRNVVAPSVKLDQESEKYPRAAVVGFAVTPISPLTLGLDVEKQQGTGVRAKIGADYLINRVVSLRAGVNDAEFAAGLGLGLGSWNFDYAMGYSRAVSDIANLGAFHRFGVQFNFGAPAPVFTSAPAPARVSVPAKPTKTKAAPAPVARGTASSTQKRAAAALDTRRDRNQPFLDSLKELGDKMDTWDGEPTADVQALVDTVSNDQKKGYFVRPADLYAAQGYVSYFTGEYARSVRSLESALKADPENTDLASRLRRVQDLNVKPSRHHGETPEIRAVREKYEQGDYANTIVLAQRILDVTPKDAQAGDYLKKALSHIVDPRIRQAKDLLDHNRFVESFVSFQKTLDYDPDNVEAQAYSTRLTRIIEKKSDLEYLSKSSPKADPAVVSGIAEYEKGLRLYGHGDLAAARASWEAALPQLKSQPVLYDAVRSTLADIGR